MKINLFNATILNSLYRDNPATTNLKKQQDFLNVELEDDEVKFEVTFDEKTDRMVFWVYFIDSSDEPAVLFELDAEDIYYTTCLNIRTYYLSKMIDRVIDGENLLNVTDDLYEEDDIQLDSHSQTLYDFDAHIDSVDHNGKIYDGVSIDYNDSMNTYRHLFFISTDGDIFI